MRGNRTCDVINDVKSAASSIKDESCQTAEDVCSSEDITVAAELALTEILEIQLANLLMYLRSLMQLKVFAGGTRVGHYLTLSAFWGEKRASN